MQPIIIAIFLLFPVVGQSRKPRAKFSIGIDYSESADVFEVMDNVSYWLPGYHDKAYLDYWKEKFPLNDEDKQLLIDYSKLRKKYFKTNMGDTDPLVNPNGLFTPNAALAADSLAVEFHRSKRVDEALKRSLKIIKPDEAKFLEKFYLHFKPKLSQIISESPVLGGKVKELTKELKKSGIKSYVKKIAKFYNVPYKFKFRVLFVWYPPVDRASPVTTSGSLLMRFNPAKHLDQISVTTVMQELIHVYSALQSQAQKKSLTKLFLDHCPVSALIPTYSILEDPLALALGVIGHEQKKKRRKFNPAKVWHPDAYTNLMASLLAPVVTYDLKRKKNITNGIVKTAATYCSQLVSASKSLSL